MNIFKILIIVLSVIICFILGFWQLDRLKNKQKFLKNFKNEIIFNHLTNKLKPYKKVKLTGNFIGKNIFLYSKNLKSNDKYKLMSCFKTTNDQLILVDRGFISDQLIGSLKTLKEYKKLESREIYGITKTYPKIRFNYGITNDFKNNQWFSLNYKEIENYLKVKLLPIYIIEYNPNEQFKLENYYKINVAHLEYALTWFGLGVAIIVITLINIKFTKK